MKVTQEKLPASKIGLEIEIPAEMSKKAYDKVVQDLSRSASIPGFRKGKVPRHVLLQRLGPQRIKETALEQVVQDGFKQAIEQEALEAIGNYQVLSSLEQMLNQFKPGEPFTFSASVDVLPEVKLGDYTGLNIKAEETAYDPSQVDNFLEERRVERANLIPVEGRSAQMGDVAVVDYTGRFANQEGDTPAEISGAQATDFEIELKQGQFLEDLLNGIVGMSPGDTKEVPVEFPQDYPREDLAGVSAVFTIVLKDLKEKELPALDDDFAQEVSEFETLAEFRESLESRFREKVEQETAASIEQALLEELVKRVEVDLPETMIEKEVENILAQTAMQLTNYGMDVKKLFTAETLPQMKERSRPDAINRLTETLAIEEIIQRESFKTEPEAVEAKIKELKEQLKGKDFDQQRLEDYVESDLLKEKAINHLKEHATIELLPKGSLATDEEDIMGLLAAGEEETQGSLTVDEDETQSEAIEVTAETIETSASE